MYIIVFQQHFLCFKWLVFADKLVADKDCIEEYSHVVGQEYFLSSQIQNIWFEHYVEGSYVIPF